MNTLSLFGTDRPPALNVLTEPERMALVESVKMTCAKEARAVVRANPAHEFEDLEQEALLACVEAARRWCPNMGTKFNTYATSCVRRHLANVVTNYRGESVVNLESWDSLPAKEREEELEEVPQMSAELAAIIAQLETDGRPRSPLTEEQEVALNRLGEPARSVVTLLIVYGFNVEQVAEQLGRAVKDIKLIARNAGKSLPRELARASGPSLFAGVA